jgi:D-lactate dehydrogenase (cytochrome)
VLNWPPVLRRAAMQRQPDRDDGWCGMQARRRLRRAIMGHVTFPERPDHSAGIAAFAAAFGERFTTSRDVCKLHGNSSGIRGPSDGVVYAESTEDVVEALRLCREHRMPLIPWGAGTSVDGNTAAWLGGVSLDLSRMNAVLRVSPEDQDCTVQAGITRADLNRYLRDTGLFFPIDACPEASIGGMASLRASGTTAIRYGTMREQVLGLTVVLANGEVIRTGGRARKSAAGYDLTHLFVGAAGTLGVITEVTLRLQGIPEHVMAATCAFPDLDAAMNAVIGSIQMGVPFAKIEIMDALQIKFCNGFMNLGLPELPHLFIEFDGLPEANAAYAALFDEIASGCGGQGFQMTGDREERERIWTARHNNGASSNHARPDSMILATDVTVPISRLAECLTETHADLGSVDFPGPISGHVGDGNFHVLLLLERHNAKEAEQAEWFMDRLIERAIRMGGTCSGEHGMGLAKKSWAQAEFGAGGVAAMRMVKQAFDPLGILNPGKIFD